MRQLIFFLVFPLLFSCQSRQTNFYNDCPVSEFEVEQGIEVSDSLGKFSIKIPESTWKVERTLTEFSNRLTVGDTSFGYLMGFSVSEAPLTEDWNWQEELNTIDEELNVVEQGKINFHEDKHPYHLIHFEEDRPPLISFYVPVIEPGINSLFTLNLLVEYSEDYKSRICRYKPLIESFVINKR